MFAKKSLMILLINTFLAGGFPDFRIGKQARMFPGLPMLSDTPVTLMEPSPLSPLEVLPSPEQMLTFAPTAVSKTTSVTPNPDVPTPTTPPTPTASPTPVVTPTPTVTPTPMVTPTKKPTPGPTRVPIGTEQSLLPGELTFSYPEPAPLNTDTSTYTMIVNKEYLLPNDYIPYLVEPDVEIYHKGINERRYLQPIAADSLKEMFDAAEKDGCHMVLRCGFRSYTLQEQIYSWNLRTYGYYEATRYHALPGTSEHQTGLAVDLCCEATGYNNNFDFINTKEYTWLLINAHHYGWILRYPKHKSDLTGYNFEPWHFRYVGVELATYLKMNDLVLEEYYNVPPTTNLLAVPEQYWKYLSDADYALMMEEIAAYEKQKAETQLPEVTPTPEISEPEIPSDFEEELPDKQDPISDSSTEETIITPVPAPVPDVPELSDEF